MKKIKKILSLVLSVLMVVSIFQTIVFAEACEHVWDDDGICTLCGTYQSATQNSDGYYEISNSVQLGIFAEKVNSGETDLKAVLTANVDVSSKSDFTIGTKDNPFSGVFDGDGHTLTVNITSTKEAAAPFSYAGGVTIKNLTIAGTVATSAKYAGGFVGSTTGTVTLENCLSLVTINSSVNGDGTHGGFIGVVNSADGVKVTVTNCGFAGAINGKNTTSCGGFAGWLNAPMNVKNSFVSATYTASTESSNTIARNPKNLTLDNVYYLKAFGDTPEGAVAKTEEQFASGEVAFLLNKKSSDGVWKQNLGKNADSFPNFGGGTVYANFIDCSGAVSEYGNEYFNEIPEHVSYNDNGICTVCGTYQSATLNSDGYYEIGNIGQFLWFVDQRNVYGRSVNAKLKNDIDLSGIDYTPVNAPYTATFDGNGHTISNMTINTKKVYYSGGMVYGYLGLFGGLGSNGVVKNLTLTGDITCTEEMTRVGGVAGYMNGAGAEISNIDSYVNITSGSATGKTLQFAGGIVGITSSEGEMRVENCRYFGSINLNKGTYVGGITGYLSGQNNKLFKSVNNGDIRINDGGYVGGVVGCMANHSVVESCLNKGNVTVYGYERIGGVVGSANMGNFIKNCGNTATVTAISTDSNNPAPYVGGVLGFVWRADFGGMTGCYSTGFVDAEGDTKYRGSLIGWSRKGPTPENTYNNYYIGFQAYGTLESTGTLPSTELEDSQIYSGELTYSLNGGVTDGTQGWYQDLTASIYSKSYPHIYGETVYKYTDCKGNVNYANKALSSGAHKYRTDGVCAVCGDKCSHTYNANEVCTVCGYSEIKLVNGYYEISNAEQLYQFAAKVNGGENTINGKLTADIVVNPGTFDSEGKYTSKNGETPRAWTPIGNSDIDYTGKFDGNGKTVSGLYFNGATVSGVGLFGILNSGAEISRVGVVNSYFSGKEYVGGIAGKMNNACKINDCYNTSTVSGQKYVGGIAGSVYAGPEIDNCYNTGNISASTSNAGGIVGEMWGYDTTTPTRITNCYNTGEIWGRYRYSGAVIGGLVGKSGTFCSNCYYLTGCAVDLDGVVHNGVGALSGSTTADVSGETTSKSAQAFASGEVCYLLNNSKSTGVWKQALGKDKSPKLTGDTVVYNADNGTYYNVHNWSKGTCTGCGTQHVDHNFEKDICTVCGTYQPATLNSDGYYEIGNAGQFLWFGEKINAEERSINGKLVDDIDLSGIKYIPITAPYRGTFDGCGHKISNMNVPSEEFNYQGTMKYGYAGLFGGLGAGAVVKNFTLTGSITCSADMKYVGGVAAYAMGGAEISNVKCYVDIKDGGVKNKAIDRVGGIVGQISSTPGSVVKDCSYHGNITLDRASSTGGIVGYADSEGKVLKCVNHGKINVNNGSHVGGVVGSLWKATVENCMNYGTVEMHTHDCVGGVVGYANSGSLIKSSANIGKVSGTSTASSDQEPYIGGILGYVNDNGFSGIEKCYNYGTLTASPGYKNCGAIIGWGRSGATADKFKNNYYLGGENVKAVGTTNDTKVTATSATASQFASGEIAYLLNSGVTDGTQGWYQELTDTAKLDEYPVISGKTVYKFTDCKGRISYVNSELADGSHIYSTNGFCIDCDAYQPCESKDGYYEIGNAGQLYWFAEKVNGGKNKINGRLTADIVVNPGTFSLTTGEYTPKDNEKIRSWVPIGNGYADSYRGAFDGNGKTVSGLYCRSDEYQGIGLFGFIYAGASIKNTGVVNSAFFHLPSTDRSYVAGLVGYAETRYEKIEITDCYSSVYVNSESSQLSYVGGLIGYAYALYGYNITVSNCYSTGSVAGNMTSRTTIMAGGLIGNAYVSSDTEMEISGCYNTGNVKANGTNAYQSEVGGVIGYCGGSGNITIKNCYNTGDLTAEGAYVYLGGLVSYLSENGCNIQNCYSIGSITGTGSERLTVGGVIGKVEGGTIENCYYLNSIASTGIGTGTGTTTAKTANEFASGEVAYLLQSGVGSVTETDDEGNEITYTPLVWGQTSSTDGSIPLLTSKEDYRVLPVVDGDATVNYSVHKKGETNGDGQVDIYDYQNAVNIALSNDNIKEIADKYDYNGDGVIDALDCSTAKNSGVTDEVYQDLCAKVEVFEGRCYIKTADINGDGTVDILDVSTLERLISGNRVKV